MPATQIGGLFFLSSRSVEVDDMQPAGASLDPARGHRHRVVGEHRRSVHAPFAQAHALSILDVDGRNEKHLTRVAGSGGGAPGVRSLTLGADTNQVLRKVPDANSGAPRAELRLNLRRYNAGHARRRRPNLQRVFIKKNELIADLERHSMNRIYPQHLPGLRGRAAMLFRPVTMRDHGVAAVLDGAGRTYSMWEGYLKRESTSAVRTWLAGRNISMEVIHTSGHASVADLKRFAAALAP